MINGGPTPTNAFAGLETWPVDHLSAAIVTANDVLTYGDTERSYRLASISKILSAWAILIAVEEGVATLDAPLEHVAAPAGATLRHLLSHAAGFGFDGDDPITEIERRRIYSNTGIERAADEVAASTGIPFAEYLHEAVFVPLGMDHSVLVGSPAADVRSTVSDMVKFLQELRRPRLLAPTTYAELVSIQYPELSGIVPGVGRFTPCPWGLGIEIRGEKSPHWMGRTNAPSTVGHFGGAGTMLWFDPVADVAALALTDRRFDEWSDVALTVWPAWSDQVIAQFAAKGSGSA